MLYAMPGLAAQNPDVDHSFTDCVYGLSAKTSAPPSPSTVPKPARTSFCKRLTSVMVILKVCDGCAEAEEDVVDVPVFVVWACPRICGGR